MSPIPLGIFAVSGAAPVAANAYDLISSQILTGSAATVTFSSLNTAASGYSRLQLRVLGRDDISSTNTQNMTIRFNSDNGGNYAWHTLNGTGSTVTTNLNIAGPTSIVVADMLPGSTSAANAFGAAIIDILDFSNTNKNKTVKVLHGSHTAGETDINLTSGLWMNTNAITSITLAAATFFLPGSRVSLYGIKG